MITTQIELDYMQAANQRVASDTGLLNKKTTLNLAAGSSTLALPPETIQLQGLYLNATPIGDISNADYMRLATGATNVTIDQPVKFTVIGRTLYFYPTSATALVLTAFYSYRPATIDTGSTFELTGVSERLIERLVSAYLLIDDGQPELAQSELAGYITDMTRVKRRDHRRQGRGHALPIAGRRRAPG